MRKQWQSRLLIKQAQAYWLHRTKCPNLGCVMWLARMSLIPKFNLAKCSNRQACMQAKPPCKPYKVAEERKLAPLELIHSDMCERKVMYMGGAKKYFMALTDDFMR